MYHINGSTVRDLYIPLCVERERENFISEEVMTDKSQENVMCKPIKSDLYYMYATGCLGYLFPLSS